MSKNFAANKLRIPRNKLTTAIALVLVLTVAATFTTCLPVNAAVPEYPTYAFLSVTPNPVGVGQTVYIVMWLDEVSPIANQVNFKGYTVTVTRPDGTTTTLGPFDADAVSNRFTAYVPDKVGTWYFQFSFPGQLINGTFMMYPAPPGKPYPVYNFIGYFKASTSKKVSLVVTQEPAPTYPEYPLPDQWTRPIEGEIKGAGSEAGNWCMNVSASRWNPYTKAPNTAHILWTRPLEFGGIVGGQFGDISYYSGLSYEGQWSVPAIVSGRLYYNQRLSPSTTWMGTYCVDLRTGETIWFKNGTTYSGVQLYDYETMNQHGVIPILWSGTSKMYDAYTGEYVMSLSGSRGGSTIYGKDGNMYVYVYNAAQGWLALWNSSLATNNVGGAYRSDEEGGSYRPPLWGTRAWSSGVVWNVTIPKVVGTNLAGTAQPSISKVTPDVLLAVTGSIQMHANYQMEVAYSTKDGHQMWVVNRTTEPGHTTYGLMGPAGEGVYTEYDRSTMQWYGYSLYTGQKLWGPTEPRSNAWGMYCSGYYAYGKLFAVGYDGAVYCYNIKTGEHLWTYESPNSGEETIYGSWPFGGSAVFADGKMFITNDEHSPSQPYYRGASIRAIDVNTGKHVWTIEGWFVGPAIADGIIATYNAYDNRVYAFGKGPTAITVSASPSVVVNGSSVMIHGTITDQSPGAKDTPCVSDKSQEQWMEYLYYQHPQPTNATGVPVQLRAMQSNGEVIDVATVTSDIMGHYEYMWTPTDADCTYKILATFPGSESYWSSSAQTALGVELAPSPAPAEPVEIPASPDYTPLFAGIIVAVAIAIVIGLVNLLWKRK